MQRCESAAPPGSGAYSPFAARNGPPRGRGTRVALSTAGGSMRFRGCLALMLLIGGVGVGGGSAQAQSSQGGMRGIVKDATGVLPNTVVMLVNEQTGVTRQTFS